MDDLEDGYGKSAVRRRQGRNYLRSKCALKNNCAIEKPLYNFSEHAREKHTQLVKPAQIIIIEGILLFAVPEVRELFDLKIFVETDDDVRLLRRIERDMTERARDFKSIRDQYMSTVKPMHDAFVEPSKRYADVILPTILRNENGIALIISGLKKDLDFLVQRQNASQQAIH